MLLINRVTLPMAEVTIAPIQEDNRSWVGVTSLSPFGGDEIDAASPGEDMKARRQKRHPHHVGPTETNLVLLMRRSPCESALSAEEICLLSFSPLLPFYRFSCTDYGLGKIQLLTHDIQVSHRAVWTIVTHRLVQSVR